LKLFLPISFFLPLPFSFFLLHLPLLVLLPFKRPSLVAFFTMEAQAHEKLLARHLFEAILFLSQTLSIPAQISECHLFWDQNCFLHVRLILVIFTPAAFYL